MVPSVEEGKIVLIANPVSKSGRGAVAASEAARLLRERVGQERFEMLPTAWAGHGESLARELGPDVGCVIALGGDGLVNEVVNGLMARIPEDRPVLAVIPVGSGNDYAETLGMAYSVPTAVTEILRFQTVRADVGRVNGRYFAETLSFGLDAAIALDTMDRRQKSGRAGTMLYLESAVDQLFHHLQVFSFKMDVLGAEPGCAPHPEWDDAYLVAVQVGPTYGGHFRITPKARLDDGLLGHAGAFVHAGAGASSARPGRQAHGKRPHPFPAGVLPRARLRGGAAGPDGRGAGARHALRHRLRPRCPHRRRGPAVGQRKSPVGRGLVNVGGALDRIRTCGTLLRRQVLYPLSYEGTNSGSRQAGATLL